MASDVYNSTVRIEKETSPIEQFAGFKMRPLLNRFHHFGCPVYVLHRNLQAGNKGRKWDNWARVGIYLGHSTQHAKTIALVLSMETGLVSPQFHCSFDDMFETTEPKQRHLLPTSKWQEKAGFVESRRSKVQSSDERTTQVVMDRTLANELNVEAVELEMTHDEEELIQQIDDVHLAGTLPDPEPEIRTSMRERRLPAHLRDYHVSYETIVTSDPLAPEPIHPLAMKASSDPDIMYYHEAMSQPDRKNWIVAVEKELDDHEKGKHWKVVELKDLPEGTKVLPAVWAMRRKRRIDTQEIYKWKARLNIDGSKQQ